MKARIKHTDKIIDVEWNIFGWLFDSSEGKRIFNTEELDFLDNDNFDWKSFHAEAAKDILAGMMQHKVLSDSSMTLFVPKEQVVSAAIGLAYELIKQLKEKEEK